jgi:hypothetical protein
VIGTSRSSGCSDNVILVRVAPARRWTRWGSWCIGCWCSAGKTVAAPAGQHGPGRRANAVSALTRLGHATAAKTLDTYAHLWPDSDEGTRETIDSVLRAPRYGQPSAQAAVVNAWISSLADPTHRDHTAAQALGDTARHAEDALAAAERALADNETKLQRLQAAIKAGADPAALVDPLNRARGRVAAARADRDGALSARRAGAAELEEFLANLGDVAARLEQATSEQLADLYQSLDLQLIYRPGDQMLDIQINPHRDPPAAPTRGPAAVLATAGRQQLTRTTIVELNTRRTRVDTPSWRYPCGRTLALRRGRSRAC